MNGRPRMEAVSTSAQGLEAELVQLKSSVFPRQCKELARMMTRSVLLGTYEHRIGRQEHRYQQLQSLLNQSTMQLASLELLHAILTMEDNLSNSIINQLQKIRARIESDSQNIQDRIRYANNAPNFSNLRQSHDEDEVFNIARRILTINIYGTEEAYHLQTCKRSVIEDLIRMGQMKQAHDLSLKQSWNQVMQEWHRLLTVKREVVKELRVNLFGDGFSWTPRIFPKAIQDELACAEKANEVAESAFFDAMERYQAELRNHDALDGSRRKDLQHQFEQAEQLLTSKIRPRKKA